MIKVRGEALFVEGQFDPGTGTISYIVLDRGSGQCALIDPVLDYDCASGRTSTTSADRLLAQAHELGGRIQWILETHVHADHLSAGAYLQAMSGAQLGIGAGITQVQQLFGDLYHANGFDCQGGQFDRLFGDGEKFSIGQLSVEALHTPGHTPACTTYVVKDALADPDSMRAAAFVGDTLFMPDFGTARCDFPGGDARQLYQSIGRLFTLPGDTTLYTAHDYQPGGRPVRFAATVAEQRESNLHLCAAGGEDAFVAMRNKRDAALALPALMLPAVQVNIHGGRLPEPEPNGVRYLKIPLNAV